MLNITMKDLLEVGVHFGHQAQRWNPKMAPYIYGERNGIHIINLSITLEKLKEAYEFIKSVSGSGGDILFVGTKKQAQDAIKEEAERSGTFYVNYRWLGGILTNFSTIRKNLDKLEEITKMEEEGTLEKLPRKEVMMLRKKKEKLERILSGIRGMERLPSMLYIVDPKNEITATYEARKLKIPIVSLVDTNCDPDMVDYVIPGNDDAIRSIRLVTSIVANAVIEGRGEKLEGGIGESILSEKSEILEKVLDSEDNSGNVKDEEKG
ncbi:MAG: 30S ribosomal protein S2 [bacterium]